MVLWILFEESDQCTDANCYYLENENEEPFHVSFLFGLTRRASCGRL